MHELDPDDNRPPYVQVAEAIRAAVENGRYRPGDKLPTQAEIVSTYGVSVATVKKALATLQAAGLIVSRRGEGAFVRVHQGEPVGLGRDDAASLRQAISELAARMDRVELRLDEQR
ncbi:MAG: GntR family transcriptional regulator [Actinomycetota bacterium]|nr:GntR family transcriptional regulator [Actinomycetota bacterium]